MSALSSAKELAQLCVNVLSVSISAAGLRRLWKRVATSAQWGWSRSLSATALSLTSLSLVLKILTRIIKRTWLYSAKAARRLWWQIRWDRDEMRLRLHSGPGRLLQSSGDATRPRRCRSVSVPLHFPSLKFQSSLSPANQCFFSPHRKSGLFFCAALQAREAHCS